jgi:hypothetical protein
MRTRFIPSSLLLLALAGCSNRVSKEIKPRDIPKEKVALEITVKVFESDYFEKMEGPTWGYVLNPLKEGEEPLTNLENTLMETITENAKLMVEYYATENGDGTCTDNKPHRVEVNIVYPTGIYPTRESFMMSYFK